MATTTNTLGTLEIAAVSPKDGETPTDTVEIKTAYMRDWESILKDVMAAINFRSEYINVWEIDTVEYTDDHDVIVTFASNGAAGAFLHFVDTLDTNR
jgi:hypothetical protein